MQVKLFPSFSGLLSLLNRGFVWEDSPECVYFFCCMKEGISETFEVYNYKGKLNEKEILEKLGKAESEGRVLWRKEKNCTYGSETRMEWLIAKLESMGIPLSKDGKHSSEYYDAGWSLPALARWSSVNLCGVTIVDCEYSASL